MSTPPVPLPPHALGVALNRAYLYGRVVSTTNPQEARATLWLPVAIGSSEEDRVDVLDPEGLLVPALRGETVLVEAAVMPGPEGGIELVVRRVATGGPGKWVWSPTHPEVSTVALAVSTGFGLTSMHDWQPYSNAEIRNGQQCSRCKLVSNTFSLLEDPCPVLLNPLVGSKGRGSPVDEETP